MVAKGFASTRFIKHSIVITIIFIFTLHGALGKGLTISISHWMNSYSLVMLTIGVAAILEIGECYLTFLAYVCCCLGIFIHHWTIVSNDVSFRYVMARWARQHEMDIVLLTMLCINLVSRRDSAFLWTYASLKLMRRMGQECMCLMSAKGASYVPLTEIPSPPIRTKEYLLWRHYRE